MMEQDEVMSIFKTTEDSETEAIFEAEEVDVVYITSPNGYKFRVEFKFEWQLLSKPGEKYNEEVVDKDGIPTGTDSKTKLTFLKHSLNLFYYSNSELKKL